MTTNKREEERITLEGFFFYRQRTKKYFCIKQHRDWQRKRDCLIAHGQLNTMKKREEEVLTLNFILIRN